MTATKPDNTLPELPSGMIANMTPSLRDRILAALKAINLDRSDGEA